VVTEPALEFRWQPEGCPVYSVSIVKGTLHDSGWYVETLGYRNGIESPVRYGVVPPGAYASPPETLHGGPYRLAVTRLNDYGEAEIAAELTFNAP
jgi:hypothetical protein